MHSIDLSKLALSISIGVLIICALYWLSFFVRCYERRDMTRGDKLLWTAILLVPIFGVVLYIGLGGQWKKRQISIPDTPGETTE